MRGTDMFEKLFEKKVKKDLALVDMEKSKYLNSTCFIEHLDAAKEAIKFFNESPKTSENLLHLYMVLHASFQHCDEEFASKLLSSDDRFFYALIKDCIKGEMYKKICEMMIK
jgi:hypothetical protein